MTFQPSPDDLVAEMLDAFSGDKDAAMLVLASMLITAHSGMSMGMLRLPTASKGNGASLN